ncbi:MAG: hypothetical protein ASUL_02309 [Candidatus Aramenus sulfurataquae]|jgi:hypothetical protein|uniref:Uncharacterized protein n=2 Tax=Candidatus Aramenus sulfurataquae TaxID=1326980 RepID=W7L808_9CREN|nr:MAG: hypothetical protein ASUL_02309 [Candidatus Aramenus sulfurataquae]MCL7344183.1 hypothetical protein [Candidatus Aramenus sulfurataquae]
MDSGISITAEKLIDYTAKRASMIASKENLERIVGISSKQMAERAVDRVAFWLAETQNSLLYCKLCNRGPFTKKGLYLHLTRVHRQEIKTMLEEEIKRELKAVM